MVYGYDLRDKGQGQIMLKICIKALKTNYFDGGRTHVFTLGV